MSRQVEIPIPLTANHIWKKGAGGFMYATQEYKAWRAQTAILLKVGFRTVPNPCKVRIIIQSGKGWRENRDLDNVLKPCLDAFKESGLIPDDKAKYIPSITVDYEKQDGKGAVARCYFEVSEVQKEAA